MTVSGNQLLAALGSGIIPGKGVRSEIRHEQSTSFDDVLSRVMDGTPSGLGISVGKDVLPTSVSIQMREQIGRAADNAAIKGVSRAVVDLGESIVRLDVPNRILEAQIEPTPGQVVDQIDGFVSMKPNPTDAPEPIETQQPARFTPARLVRNTSLVDVLSARIE